MVDVYVKLWACDHFITSSMPCDQCCLLLSNLQRIGQSTRCGGPNRLKLEQFTEALYDQTSNLTYPALTGQCKQSIRDVETLFSSSVEDFMKGHSYDCEAKYIRVIRNWRRSCDERGLSQLERCRYNYELLNMILDELMPWHEDNYDFSPLEVNR